MMKWLVALILTALLQPTIASPDRSVVLTEDVTVGGDKVLMGDVMSPTVEPTIAKLFHDLVIGSAPAPGQTITISSAQISEVLRPRMGAVKEKMGAAAEPLRFKIPSSVRITRAVPETVESEVKKSLQELAVRQCDECTVEIQSLSLAKAKDLPRGNHFKILSDGQSLKGPVSLRVEFSSQGQVIHRGWVAAEIRWFREVPISQRSFQIGERIQEGDFKYQKKDVTFTSDGVPLAQELIGSKVRKGIRAYSPIFRSELEREKAVQRGDLVDLSTGSDGWKISIKGTAEDAGFVGDRIRVTNPSTKRIVVGVIKAKGQVEIQ